MLAHRPWPLTSNFDLPSWPTHRACWEAPGRQIAVSDRGVVHQRADSRTLTQHASTESHCCLDNGSMAGGTRTTENSKRHVTGRLRRRLRHFRRQTAQSTTFKPPIVFDCCCQALLLSCTINFGCVHVVCKQNAPPSRNQRQDSAVRYAARSGNSIFTRPLSSPHLFFNVWWAYNTLIQP